MTQTTETPEDADALPLAAARVAAVEGGAVPAGIDLLPRQVLLGDIDMRIDRRGVWHYRGSAIKRQALVRLFARVLRRDAAGDYWLITPAEVARLVVEDTPFQAVAMRITGSGPDQDIIFRTDLDHNVTLSPARPLRVETAADGAPRPLLVVADDGTEARLTRQVFYDLVDLGVIARRGHGEVFGVYGGGAFFPLADAADAALMRDIREGLEA